MSVKYSTTFILQLLCRNGDTSLKISLLNVLTLLGCIKSYKKCTKTVEGTKQQVESLKIGGGGEVWSHNVACERAGGRLQTELTTASQARQRVAHRPHSRTGYSSSPPSLGPPAHLDSCNAEAESASAYYFSLLLLILKCDWWPLQWCQQSHITMMRAAFDAKYIPNIF